jgi:endonuclease/exonuclease/phosphatase family metal-dependent hydrolase
MKNDFCASSFLIFLSLLVSPAGAANIKVMTQNQYIGADLTPLFAAPDEAAFNAALVTALQTVAANRPAERMRALADDIAKERPELVGLQEVYQFQCSGPGCSDPSIAPAFVDYLQLTVNALDGTYQEVATVVNLNIPGNLPIPGIPFKINGADAVLSVVDRDVILARSDIEAIPVDYTAFQGVGVCLKSSGDGCNYSLVPEAPTPLGSIDVERGFVAVDTAIDGKNYRFVTTHLEVQQPDPTNPLSQVFQSAQASELLQILLNTTPLNRSLVVVGDMNSDPAEPDIAGPLPLPAPFNSGIVTPYHQFVEAGFTDIWELRPGNAPGDTCCQTENLSNRRSALDQRIDMIFSLEVPSKVKKVRVVGDKASDKTRPPGVRLWPSDHASLTGELQFQLLTAQK